MNFWIAITALGFILCSLALYLTRYTLTTRGRIALIAGIFVNAALCTYFAESKYSKEEVVWDDRAPHWGTTPITISWDQKYFEEYNETFEESMQTWNRRIGCIVLKFVPQLNDANVRVRPFDGTQCGNETVVGAYIKENPRAPASTWFCNGYDDIQIKRLTDVREAFRIMLHEEGHALGLAHDDRGAMSTELPEPSDDDYPEYLLPSDKDVAALRERYCQ